MVEEMINEEKSKSAKITDNQVNVLMIAEKPSTAFTISKALGGKIIKKNEDAIYQFKSKFKNVPAVITVSSVFGHIYQSDFLEIHNDRKNVDPLSLYDASTRLVEAYPENLLPSFLKDISYDTDILCLWLDCDREGENICYEVIYNCYNNMNFKNYRQIYRAKFSSLTEIDVKNAYNSIDLLPNKNISASVDARRLIDLKVGVSFTRFFTNTILPEIKHIKTNVLSYGPCQTPTLWFVVNRENEIKNFTPREYYQVKLDIIFREKRIPITFNNEFFDKEEIDKILQEFKKENKIKLIESSVDRRIREYPPNGLNTVEMLKIASKFLQKSPLEIMKLAERLYSKGFISYPRTETTKYPSREFCCKTLNLFKNDKTLINEIENLTSNAENLIKRGEDAGDHPPITPCKNGRIKESLEGEKKLYEIICNYFFSSMSAPSEISETTYKFVLNSIPLEKKYESLIEKGFLKFQFWRKEPQNEEIPTLYPDIFYKFENIDYEDLETEPPEYLSESDLIELMEKYNIGTDASMAKHIDNICLRKYVILNEERKLIPSKLGKSLLDSISDIDSNLVKPEVRSEIEKSVNQIAKEEEGKSYSEVVITQLNYYKAKYEDLSKNTAQLLKKFGL